MSTFIALAVLALVALAPLVWAMRGPAILRGRRDSDLALHRAQLASLDRDRDEGRIADSEYAAARLEVQRRLLAAADLAEPKPANSRGVLLLVALLAVPVSALGLYMISGHPELPDAPLAERRAEAADAGRDTEALLETVRQRVASLDPQSDLAREGQILIGNVEINRGNYAAAAAAWRAALAVKFDPAIAAQIAEAQVQADGKVTPDSAALFRRALAAAPPDAPWRDLAQQRINEAK